MDGHVGCGVSGGGHEFADGGALLCEHGERGDAQIVESEVVASGLVAGGYEVAAHAR